MATDRAQLEAWIAETRRNQQRLKRALGPAAIIGLALLLWSRPVGLGVLGLVALTAMFGFWIMGSHILEWETRIVDLDKPPVVGRAVKRL